MQLKYNFNFEDLYCNEKLQNLDNLFLNYLQEKNTDLHCNLVNLRQNPTLISAKDYSVFILSLSPYLDQFLADFFGINQEILKAKQRHEEYEIIAICKKSFIQKRALKQYKTEDVQEKWGSLLKIHDQFEMWFANFVMKNLEDATKLENFVKYAAWACYSKEGQKVHCRGTLFTQVEKLDYEHLLKEPKLRNREGFDHTDSKPTLHKVLDQTHYCIHCHNQEKDSCSTGMKDREGRIKISPLNLPLNGCPLDEKISEMQVAKSCGLLISALAIICIDNPMVACTGHRICNDCMKSCIYQKQEPVNIPYVETGTLNDVLNLTWGFEIYSLLTRWNPLKLEGYLPLPYNNKRILVVGMGPAGFTVSHYLLNQGHVVCGIDGLKIEKPPHINTPIKHVDKLWEKLSDRIVGGFGGVAEYGITSRWDKNYLTLIRLLLERRRHFALYGGIRFGGTINHHQAFAQGFDHIVLAIGAGKPKLLDINDRLALGVRVASDFLMSLQLSGAAQKNSLANLQIRMPIIVIGGGLTAIDTATEAMAYYKIQVKKFSERLAEVGTLPDLSEYEEEIANEFLSHNKLFENSKNYIETAKTLGGVKLIYRRVFKDSPSYRLNHEEVNKALEEGIEIIDDATPIKIHLDQFNHLESVSFKKSDGAIFNIQAKSLLVAAGTSPNTILNDEYKDDFSLDGLWFQRHDRFFIYQNDKGNKISILGDSHPEFSGNVVKAMASAKKAYKSISASIPEPLSHNESAEEFLRNIKHQLSATINKVTRLTPNIIEISIHAPMATKNFRPGQFYRLQTYQTGSKLPATEAMAMTGAITDADKGIISTIVLEIGSSTNLCQYFVVGDKVVLMGPTGSPTEITKNETVMLVGGGLGNAVLFSIGKEFRKYGSKVIYFAGYKKLQDRYLMEHLEEASDQIIWCCDEAKLNKNRHQDVSYHGNILDAVRAYAKKNAAILQTIDRIIVIGSDGMMNAFNQACKTEFKNFFKSGCKSVASINSPMQCMMKEICGQCIQRHYDQNTGKDSYVFSCSNQDQSMEQVDFQHLHDRLQQNSLQEKLAKLWLQNFLRELN